MRRDEQTHTEESVENGYNRKKEERTGRLENYWAESGRGDGQGDVEKEYQLRVGEETDRAMWRRNIC